MIQRIDPHRTIIETSSNPPSLKELVRRGGELVAAPELAWFVVYSKPMCEPLALLNLLKQGYAAWLPLCSVPTVRDGKPDVRRTPFLARYLFAGIKPGQDFHPLRSTIGVSDVVRAGEVPAVIGMEDLQQIAAELAKHEERQLAKPRERVLVPGQFGEVTDGPFTGLQGLCLMSSTERVQILLHVLRARVSIPSNNVKPVTPDDIQPIDSRASLGR